MGFKSTVSSKSYRDFFGRTFVSGGGGDSGFVAGQVPSNLPPGTIQAEYLIVAGGGSGGGGGGVAGGGGGAGQFLEGTISLTIGQHYTITVGEGGNIVTSPTSPTYPSVISSEIRGKDSKIATPPGEGGTVLLTAAGGGGGGHYPLYGGQPGGSGGGGRRIFGPPTPGAPGGTAVPGVGGNPGGFGNPTMGGGGGGARDPGTDASPTIGGHGGAGDFSTITGSAVYYAGGGGGADNGGLGGIGGGGNGQAANPGVPGTTNTGGGGGGGHNTTPIKTMGNGGPGVIILAYPTAYPTISYFSPTISYTLLPAPSRPGYYVYKFTSSGVGAEIRI